MSDEKTPVKVSTAKEGDFVILRHMVGYGTSREERLSRRLMTKATKLQLVVNGKVYRRNGHTPRRSFKQLLDPTPETLAELQKWLDKDAAYAARRKESEAQYQQEREQRARIAAGWLAAAYGPEQIYAAFSQQLLNDVYAELTATGKLAEATSDQAHPTPV